VIGGKVLAVSNTQFTIRELGDNAVEEGNVRGPWGPGRWLTLVGRLVSVGINKEQPYQYISLISLISLISYI
jgi:hypothetical protein